MTSEHYDDSVMMGVMMDWMRLTILMAGRSNRTLAERVPIEKSEEWAADELAIIAQRVNGNRPNEVVHKDASKMEIWFDVSSGPKRQALVGAVLRRALEITEAVE